MLRLLQTLQDIRYSLWFMPTVIVALAIGLAMLAIDADTRIGNDVLARWPRLFGASADGARAMLQTVAGAMITVAALTFSITVLVLSMGASQYTPRVIRTFMGNRATQAVLGVFVGIFVYCLVVLRSIRGGGETFVPSLAVTLAALLALVGVGVLVYFIHHMAASIQASAIVSDVAHDTLQMVNSLYRKLAPDDAGTEADCLPEAQHWFAVESAHSGYLRSVDVDGLVRFACEHDVMVRMERAVGEFLIEGGALASVSSQPDDRMKRELNRHYTAGHYRTVEQDIAVGIQQLVDIALRALSPAMNDTTTAVLCINFISAILARLAKLRIAPENCYHDGRVVVIRRGPDFDVFLRIAFEQIRQNAQNNLTIYLQLLTALGTVAECTTVKARKELIAHQARLVWDYAQRNLHAPDQLALLEQHSLAALARVQNA